MKMKKQSLIDYLDDGIQNLDFDGTLAWNWLKHERAFELEMEFYVQNQSGHKIVDSDDTESVEPIITFTDTILLYDKTKPFDFNENDYLVTLGFNGKKGWTKGQADAFLDVLQDTLDNGESDLLDFVSDDSIQTFSLKWDAVEFQKQLEARKDESQQLNYPKF